MKAFAIREHKLFKPAIGAGLAIICGLVLWSMPMGQPLVNASYDYLFRFGARTVTNNVALILMDNESFAYYGWSRGRWDRALHAKLLDQLAVDKCRMVVFDSFFREPLDTNKDRTLAEAMRRQSNVVLMAKAAGLSLQHVRSPTPGAESVRPLLPTEPFLGAANNNCGVAWLDPDLDLTVRRHWPFPAPGPIGLQSLPWTAARLAGAQLSPEPQEQWLRYYRENAAWDKLSYCLALAQAPGYFKDKIVFIGNKPQTSVPDREEDKFCTPYTRWTGEAVGGIEIMATAFLNLVNGEWLRRPPAWLEIGMLILSGTLLGAALCQVRPLRACGLAAGTALLVMLAAVWFSQVTNFWFPWLVIVGGQVPCALGWALAGAKVGLPKLELATTTVLESGALPSEKTLVDASELDRPDTPDYELFDPPFGEGAYGRVWLARNAIGQWQALKAVYLAKFGPNASSYEREFSGIRRYKPVSDKHPGLLRVDFVSRKKRTGYFYYVMELADALAPGWEENPSMYRPRDLASVRARAEGRRLPPKECVRIGHELAAALDFLHRQGLTHRDVKPQNIVFVKGQPKLADVGLVAEVPPPGKETTWVGTPGYMPPPPEPPGTPVADIYGLGMVLYVILTGRHPGFFPELATTLLEKANPPEFMRLNAVIMKACQPDLSQRYASAAELAAELYELEKMLEHKAPSWSA